MNGFVIDAFEFCRLKDHRNGESQVSDLSRLADETVDRSGVIRWSLEGSADSFGHPMLILTVSGVVQLMCQRCLTSYKLEIASMASLILAKDDGEADDIEAMQQDDAFDVIVGSKSLNIRDLIEDEALLAIPLSPKHEACSGSANVVDMQIAKKASPFEVLKNLK
jgi:uncharacterized protein